MDKERKKSFFKFFRTKNKINITDKFIYNIQSDLKILIKDIDFFNIINKFNGARLVILKKNETLLHGKKIII
jgi:hypothetical protein